MKKISLLGCGKLGLPLAINLLDKGYIVKGSTSKKSNLDKIKSKGIEPFIINTNNRNMDLDFFDSDILVLTLPFKKSFSDPNIYIQQIEKIIICIKKSNIKHIVFTSSSSVYPKDGKLYHPKDDFIPPSDRSKVLLKCENLINSINGVSTFIIRLGGIYGKNRSVSPSGKIRRLISEKEAISLLEKGILEFGKNSYVNGFSLKVMSK